MFEKIIATIIELLENQEGVKINYKIVEQNTEEKTAWGRERRTSCEIKALPDNHDLHHIPGSIYVQRLGLYRCKGLRDDPVADIRPGSGIGSCQMPAEIKKKADKA